jgi:hypothetical protein
MLIKSIRSFITILILSSYSQTNYAQCVPNGANLIPNPSFELFSTCPTYACGFPQELRSNQTMCNSWFGIENSCPVGATPDYCRSSTETLPICSTQLTSASGNGMCLTGTHGVGYFVFAPGTNTREYVQCQLTNTLTTGTTYCFSAVVKSRAGSVGNAQCNTNGFGAYFHNQGIIDIDAQNGSLQFLGAGSIINGTPQVQATAIIPHNSCTTISGTFVATGNENFLTIGNFWDDAATLRSTGATSAYMYIDNLQLYEINPLPIDLMNFDGLCENNEIKLNWSTASERDNDFFTIEQTCDGINFTNVANIDGAGNSNSVINYSITVPNNCSGISYFRISQTDFNGAKELFDMISIDCKDQLPIEIYPNPAENELTVKIGSLKVQRIELLDAAGRLISKGEFLNGVSNTTITFDLTKMSAGVYIVKCEQKNGIIFFERFLKN